MRIRLFFLLLAMALGLPSLAAALVRGSALVPYDLTFHGTKYSVFVILPHTHFRNIVAPLDSFDAFYLNERSWDNVQSSDAAVEWLLDGALDWLIEHYKRIGPLRGHPAESVAAMESAIRTYESLKDGRSAVILITEHGSPRDIRAMTRVAVTTPEEVLLPFEKRLYRRGLSKLMPRPWLADHLMYRRRDEPMYALRRTGGNPYLPVITQPSYWWDGDIAELKNFAHSPKAARDFIPLLVFLAEIHRATRRGGMELPMKFWPPKTPDLRQVVLQTLNQPGPALKWPPDDPWLLQLVQHDKIKSALFPWNGNLTVSDDPFLPVDPGVVPTMRILPGLSGHPGFGMRISEYYLEVDPDASRRFNLYDFYHGLGFRKQGRPMRNPDFPGSRTQVMHATRDTFREVALAQFFGRPGTDAVRGIELEYLPNWLLTAGFLTTPGTPTPCPRELLNVIRYPRR